MNCSFCNNQDIKNRIICENDYAFGFPTNIPIVPGHVLVCPKRCVKTMDELSNVEWKNIFDLIKKFKQAFWKAFGIKDFNYALNEGKIAGQNVEHLHFHLLPRKEGDTGITNYDPRKFLYRPGRRQKSPEKELIKVAKSIKQFIE